MFRGLRSPTVINTIKDFQIGRCIYKPFMDLNFVLMARLNNKNFHSTGVSFISNSPHYMPTPGTKDLQKLVNENDTAEQQERISVPEALYRRIVVEVLSHDSAVLDSYERFVVAASIHLGLQIPPVLSNPFSPHGKQTALPSSLLDASKIQMAKPKSSLKPHSNLSDGGKQIDNTGTEGFKLESNLGDLLKRFSRPGESSNTTQVRQPGLEYGRLTPLGGDSRQSGSSPYFGSLVDVQRPPYSIWLRTLLKSVHVHKTHRVQYEIRSHACIFTVLKSNGFSGPSVFITVSSRLVNSAEYIYCRYSTPCDAVQRVDWFDSEYVVGIHGTQSPRRLRRQSHSRMFCILYEYTSFMDNIVLQLVNSGATTHNE